MKFKKAKISLKHKVTKKAIFQNKFIKETIFVRTI